MSIELFSEALANNLKELEFRFNDGGWLDFATFFVLLDRMCGEGPAASKAIVLFLADCAGNNRNLKNIDLWGYEIADRTITVRRRKSRDSPIWQRRCA